MDFKKRRSVGIMIGCVHSYFPREMIRGMIARAREEDISTYFFLRIHTRPFFQSILGDFSSNSYDYQFNTIHDYCRVSGVDGIIIGYGTIGFHLNRDDAAVFARRYNSRPLVLVSEKVDLPNCHSIIADNRQGMYDMVSHLIAAHGCKKILFMRGPTRSSTPPRSCAAPTCAGSRRAQAVKPYKASFPRPDPAIQMNRMF